MNKVTDATRSYAVLSLLLMILIWGAWRSPFALAAQPQIGPPQLPSGMITAYGGVSVPNRWLPCDGSEVSRQQFARLFEAIGTAYGAGDGATTFNLPDLRGRFIRGVDGSAGRDPDADFREAGNPGGNIGDNVGSVQLDSFQGHFHTFEGKHIPYSGGGGSDLVAASTGQAPDIIVDQDNVTDAKDDGVNGIPRTSSETRPLNSYVHFIIKI